MIARMAATPSELLDAIRTTCAVRRFSDAPVTDEEVLTCIRAAVQAPSGGNLQPWQFVVVRDAAVKRALGDVYKRAYERYEPAMLRATPPPRSDDDAARHARMLAGARHLAAHIGEAPALVAVLMPDIPFTLSDEQGPLDVGTLHASVYPAVQNLMLAARCLGIGTTLTTVYRIYQDEVRNLLAIPERYQIVALVPMGRPRGRFVVAHRRPAESVTHWDRFGAKRATT
jgi:nitroreductase